ncbi:radical SAM additional 4Fe4S-binding SPASM domain-containing protein [Actinokineospora diospyrosa]|uniref:Radical SAM additional 4Fe4S-binding SPASM domain-containing protein n=1 Tax=Actinokineospora diospyrosa TaxID=103728 RepID=A0ABT1IJ54_9PSEU|nr:radical SAM additional 4Fe4S-binding SPASM domain-containing protein [Actinokineospora diospyrosa]
MVHLPLLPVVPRHVTVFVNWACNLTCRECWMYGDSSAESTWLEEVKGDQVSIEMWTAIVDELAAAEDGVTKTYLTIMGGEPLMHPDLVELVRIAKTRMPNCNLDMSTNATLLPRFADKLVEAGIDDVYVSIDGPTAEVNNPIRGRKSFERAVAGMQALQEAGRKAGKGPKIALNFVVTGMNYEQLPDMVRMAEEYGIDELTVGLASYFTKEEGKASRAAFEDVTGRPFLSWAGYCNEHQHANIDPDKLERLLTEAETMSDSVEVLIAPTRYDAKAKSRFFTKDWRGIVRDNTCMKLWAQTTVLPNGDVISCTTFSDTVMGNIKGSSLREVFHNDTYARMRETIREGLQPICHRCCELNMDIDVDPALYAAAAER